MPESDRDILIELRTKVTEIHRDMTQPEGRVPKLEARVDNHAGQLNTMKGAAGMARWIIGIVVALTVGLLGLGGVVLDHILKGK